MRRVGPHLMSGGVQLDTAAARADGLLRARNVLSEDGAVRVRGGSDFVYTAPPTYTMKEDATPVLHPSSWAGQTVVYVSSALLDDVLPGDEVVTQINFSSHTPSVAEGAFTFEFWSEDDEWVSMDVLNVHVARGLGPYEGADGNGLIELRFVVPHAWKSAQPSGTPSSGRWIRMTSSVAIPAGAYLSGASQTTYASRAIDSQDYSVGGVGFTDRAGRSRFLVMSASTLGAPAVDACVNVFDLFDAAVGGSSTDSSLKDPRGTPCAVYVPDVDKLFMWTGESYVTVAADDMVGAYFFDVSVPFTPDLAAPDYSDIPLSSALPEPRTMALFAGRVFIVDAGDRSRFLWSAPGAFFDVWPMLNEARVRDGGEINAIIEFDGAGYFFTDRGIWRALFGDGSGKNESDLFLEKVTAVTALGPMAIAETPLGIIFAAVDGIYVFDGRSARRLSKDVARFFGPTSRCEAPVDGNQSGAVIIFDPINSRAWFFYRSPSSTSNDSALVVDLESGACWPQGAAPVATLDDTTGALVGRGLRADLAVWHDGKVFGVSRGFTAFSVDGDGDRDLESPVEWVIETHNQGFGRSEAGVVSRVDVSMERSSSAAVTIGVIPDGNLVRVDERTVAPELDQEAGAEVGVVDLSVGAQLSPLEESFGPVRWRGRKRCRNFRVRLSGQKRARFMSWTADVDDERGAR